MAGHSKWANIKHRKARQDASRGKDRPGHDFRYALNSSKIKKTLRWKPKINLDQGITKTVDWYIKNQKYFEKINEKNFSHRW